MISSTLKILEDVWKDLNTLYFEDKLSIPVLTIQSTPKSFGHFTTKRVWKDKENSHFEINIGAESLDRDISDVIATLLHEMVHQYCCENDIKDTSRGNTYHNKRFKAEAEKRGLVIEYSPRIGFSTTKPGQRLIDYIEQKGLDSATLCRETPEKTTVAAKKKSHVYECPECGQSLRTQKELNLVCGECGIQMEVK